ncbi:SUN domain-containing protein [Trichoderma simmonsii]|uniref:SUN domain-containing protein n=1 Tax=Trichoderma simmonsii TaxID=1491479 RepID=A0A8G0LDI6_9HYPO|nr:SUN domain-containing protein [Trichoderma simmonsii]
MTLPSCIWHAGLTLLLLSSGLVQANSKAAPQSAPGQCDARTINYITHALPSLCLKTSWTDSIPAPTKISITGDYYDATERVTQPAVEEEPSPSAAIQNDTLTKTSASDTFTTPFMSFEDWKEMMLKETGQDPQDLHLRNSSGRQKGDRPSHDVEEALGEEGEISLTFDDYSDGEGTRTGTYAEPANSNKGDDVDEALVSKDGKAPIYRSKDAGQTCKERFSYSSFDAGATVLKAGPQAKNAKAILVENKDSYMLLECAAQNKYVIVELSDDILIDTIVIANFEFFSSMIRHFRVSVSDRYPVKMDKWREIGIFEAANSRDIQAFLVQNPQIWAKYIRLEFITHYGNEYYCPVSLLRVHGSRMLDSWKDSETGREDDSHEDDEEAEEEEILSVPAATVVPPSAAVETTVETTVETRTDEETIPPPVSTSLAPLDEDPFYLLTATCAASPTVAADGTPGSSATASESVKPQSKDGALESDPISPDSPRSNATQVRDPSTTPPLKQTDPSKPAVENAQVPVEPVDSTGTGSGTGSGTGKPRSTSSASAATPTVQGSFFNSITKRLQQVESNLTLSLKYVEDQSRLMQDALQKTEQKQVSKLTRFLGDLNSTVLAEMRNVREQYEQIWQSTVLALESQREQSERDIVALSTRLNLLADEVVFQKRMAIVQAILLLSCLFLVIFSRGVPIPYLAALQEQAAGIAYTSPPPYSGHGSHGFYKPDPGVQADEQPVPSHIPVVSVSSFEAAPNVPSKRMTFSSLETTESHQPIREAGQKELPRRHPSHGTPGSQDDDNYSDIHHLDRESRFHPLRHPAPNHLNTPRKPLPSLPEHLVSNQDS